MPPRHRAKVRRRHSSWRVNVRTTSDDAISSSDNREMGIQLDEQAAMLSPNYPDAG
jgi:hypothetical protein